MCVSSYETTRFFIFSLLSFFNHLPADGPALVNAL